MNKLRLHIALITFVFVGFLSELKAQIPGVPIPIGVPIGIGIKLTSTYPLPYANLAADYRSVYLYRASEFSDTTDFYHAIFGIGFNVSVNQGAPLRNFKIRLKEVDWNAMPANPDMSGAMVVYERPFYVETGGINWHYFNEPYCWDLSKNIAIEICVTNPADEHSLNATVAKTTPFDSLTMASWHEWNNSGNSICEDPGSGLGLLYPQRPVTYFHILEANEPDVEAKHSINPEEIINLGSEYPVDFEFRNLGCPETNDYIVGFQWRDEPPVYDTITGINLKVGESYLHHFDEKISTDSLYFNHLKLWVKSENDVNVSNDTLYKLIFAVDSTLRGLDYNGDEFWLAYMANHSNGAGLQQFIYVTSPNGANVEVNFPLLGWNKFFSVAPNQVYKLPIPNEIAGYEIPNDQSETVQPTSFYVKSDADITVYGLSSKYQSSDGFLAIPKRSLGKDYQVIAPEGSMVVGGIEAPPLVVNSPAEFIVIATEDNTEVKIEPAENFEHAKKGEVIKVILNKGENFLVQAEVAKNFLGIALSTPDLTGTKVIANKRVSVISGSKCALVPGQSNLVESCQACDHIMEQSTPLNTSGSRFILADFELKPGDDILRVMNPHSTPVTVNISGDMNKTVSVPANSYSDIRIQGAIIVDCDKTVQVLQMCTGGKCLPISFTDPFISNVIPEWQWGNVYSYSNAPNSNLNDHYITIIKRSKEGRVARDGNYLNNESFTQIPGSDYYYLKTKDAAGSHRITGDSVIMVYVYGFGYEDSYGYPASGAKLNPRDVPPLEITAYGDTLKCWNDRNGVGLVEILSGVPPYTIQWENGDSTLSSDSLSPGFYSVTVTDDYYRIANQIVEIVAPDSISLNDSLIHINCFGDNTGEIHLDPEGGTAPYNIVNSSDLSIFKLPADTFFVEVEDQNGCIVGDSLILNQSNKIILNTTSEMPSCPDEDDGKIHLEISGGAKPFQSTINGVVFIDSAFVTAGNININVTDSLNCKADTSFVLNDPEEIRISYETQKVGCYGDSLGWIKVNSTGGRENHFYVLNQDTNTTGEFFNLSLGSYEIMVGDSFCTQSIDIYVDTIYSPRFTVNTLPEKCSENNGVVSVNASGGTTNYKYNWGNGFTQNNTSNFSEGEYLVIASDGICIDTLNFSIENITPPEFVFEKSNAICDENNAQIIIDPIKYWKKYQLSINGNDVNSDTIAGLDQGNYIIELTDSACSVSEDIIINRVSTFRLLDTNIVRPTCNQSNGSITLIIESGASDFTVEWLDNQSNSLERNNLPAGNYTVLVKDSLCEKEYVIALANYNGPEISEATTPETCEANNGKITLSVTGGSGTYTYSWADYPDSSNAEISNLDAGFYAVEVNDGICSNFLGIEVEEIPLFSFDFETVSSHCNLPVGEISITAENYQGTFASMTNNDGNWSNFFMHAYLDTGWHSLTVADQYCSLDTVFFIDNIPGPVLSYTSNSESCESNNGIISLSANAYTSDLSYYYGNRENETENPIYNLDSGWHKTYVFDGFCWDSVTAQVNHIDVPEAFISTSPDHCNLGIGSFIVDSLRGTGTIQISYNNQYINQGDQVNNLDSGWHYFTVIDDLCEMPDSVFIDEIQSPIIVTDSLKGLSCREVNGLIHVSAQGDEDNYNISWSDGSTEWQRDSLDLGTYTATVSGEHCSTTQSFDIIELPALNVDYEIIHPAHCNNELGSVLINYSDNVGDVNLNTGNNTLLNPDTIFPIASGNYKYFISDDYCQDSISFIMSEGKTIELSATGINETCEYQNGSILANVDNEVGNYSFTLNGTANTNPFNNLTAGDYQIIVFDSICSDTTYISLINLPSPDGELLLVQKEACDLQNAIAEYQSNTSEVLTFKWNNHPGTYRNENLSAGDNTLLVSNENCTDTIPFFIEEFPEFSTNIMVTPDYCNLGNGSITINASGETNPFYLLGQTDSLTQTIDSVKAGTYVFDIVDRFGCLQTDSATVNNEVVSLSNDAKIVFNPSWILVGDSITVSPDLPHDWEFYYWIVATGNNTDTSYQIVLENSHDYHRTTLVARHVGGCIDYLESTVKPSVKGIIYAPNAFTPDGDGINDFFKFYGEHVKSIEGEIYDRWGHVIQSFSSIDDTWDGTKNHEPVQIGVYNYRVNVEFESGYKKIVSGHVSLIR